MANGEVPIGAVIALDDQVEPCAICVGAIVHARIGTLIYGAPEPKTGAVQSTMKLLDDPSWNHRVMVLRRDRASSASAGCLRDS